MRIIVKSSVSVAMFCTGSLFSVPVLAQGDQSVEGDAAAIVVTARRVEERLQDVPISITVFNQQQLSNRNINTASELATYTPSLASNSRYGPDKSSFAIRGFAQEGLTAPSVGVYFAEAAALRAAAGTASGNGAGVGALFDLQNVQVLKGPQGTLFGRNTTGGAILLVPQKPTGRFEGYVEGSIGNYDLRRVQAAVNIPVSDSLRLRFGVDRNKRDGYLRNRSGIGPDALGDVDYTALRLSAVLDVTPDIENYFIANYSLSKTNGTLFRVSQCERDPARQTGRLAFTAQAACNQIDRQNARGDGLYDVELDFPNPFSHTEQWQLINSTVLRLSDTLTVKNILSYGQFHERFNFNITGDNFTVTSGANTGRPFQNIVLYVPEGQNSAAQDTFSEELQFQGRAGDGKFIWQAGLYYEKSKPLGDNVSFSQNLLACTNTLALQCSSYFGTGGSGGSLTLSYSAIGFEDMGAYAQASYNISDKLTATAGLRYTSDKSVGEGKRITVRFPTPNAPVGSCTDPRLSPGKITLDVNDCYTRTSQESGRPTWMMDLEYKPIDDVMLYAKYARGYRQGGVNPSLIGIDSWQPEKVDMYEIGAKTSFSGRLRGYLNVAAFYNDFSSQQLSAIATSKPAAALPGARVIINAGQSRIQGVEVDGAINPLEGVKVDVGYAYLDTKLVSFVAPVLAADSPYASLTADSVIGGALPLSPKHRISLTGTYTLPLPENIGRISIGATFVHTSSQIASTTTPFGTLPASELVNANLNWNSVGGLPLDIALFVTNLTKAAFPLNVSNSYSSLGFESVVPNQPRMYGLRLRYSFGR